MEAFCAAPNACRGPELTTWSLCGGPQTPRLEKRSVGPVTDRISPLAGHLAPSDELTNIPRLLTAYYCLQPEPGVVGHRVSFGTSGHRGQSLRHSFNDWHVAAMTQAICDCRQKFGIQGPLYLGADTHALSDPARATAIEVLAANGVDLVLSKDCEYTPTPVVSHAIVMHNRRLRLDDPARADGIVITPSHNPPDSGGFKYNPPHGGPAGPEFTQWIEQRANHYISQRLAGIRRTPYQQAVQASTTHQHDYLSAYVNNLASVVDMEAIAGSGVRIGVDPLGGAGVHYWGRIAERYRLNLTVVDDRVDPTFAFVPLDWDGQIRMDPSSAYAMQRLLALKNDFDVALACDTDHDRHGIVTAEHGLLAPNHYLSVMVEYLFAHRPQWNPALGVGKTVVTTRLINMVCARNHRKVFETPVGFKWFSDALLQGQLGFSGEESAGATFLRRDGTAWTTDKDGLICGLLAAEVTARRGSDPGSLYRQIVAEYGEPFSDRIDAAADEPRRRLLGKLQAKDIRIQSLGGEPVTEIIDRAPGNGEPINGFRVSTESAWFAARPSGTEDIYKIYAESFRSPEHLQEVLKQAQDMIDQMCEARANQDLPVKPGNERAAGNLP